jgi:SARP family transcriptional regulator, regulator of embCAB operon
MASRVRYTVLGPLGVDIDGNRQPIGGLKQRALFAALITARSRTVSTESLANAAWNGNPPANYSATVQVFVAGFRKLFRDNGLDPKAHLLTAAPGYRLVAADDESDLARFALAVRAARERVQAGRLEDASRLYRSAVDEFSGDVLADLRGLAFADDFSTAIEEERIDAVVGWVEAEIACGRAEPVIPQLVTLTRTHSLREPLWAQLITALYMVGRQSDALDACRRLRSTLADELGIDPTPALQDLESRILRQEKLSPSPSAAALAATMTEDDPAVGNAHVRDSSGRVYPIAGRGLHIGRMPDNDVVVDSPKVSRYHAVISGSAAGFVVRDLRSSNGTRVSGERITDLVTLADNDEIVIGDITLTFEANA